MLNQPMEITALSNRVASVLYNNTIPCLTADKLLIDKAFIEGIIGKKPIYADITLLNITKELKRRKAV